MKKNTFGIVFPAFGMGYSVSFPEFQTDFEELLSRAAKIVPLDRTQFEKVAKGILEDNLQAHYVCYINSCLISRILKKKEIPSDYVAGYSMGIFATLFHAESLSFEDGLSLMHGGYKIASKIITDGERYGMGVVIGLSYGEVASFVETVSDVDIIDISNQYVTVLSGKRTPIETILAWAKEKGSLQCKMLPIELPYHSRFMKGTDEKIKQHIHIEKLSIHAPRYPVLSSVSQKILTTVEDVQEELLHNINQKMNWLMTMEKMLALGVNLFVECGGSENLSKIAKFIPGTFEFYHPKIFAKLWNKIRKTASYTQIPKKDA